jgi:hypothetical protein
MLYTRAELANLALCYCGCGGYGIQEIWRSIGTDRGDRKRDINR